MLNSSIKLGASQVYTVECLEKESRSETICSNKRDLGKLLGA